MENVHGIDPNHRCTAAAVWRRRRLLGSQSWPLVIKGFHRLELSTFDNFFVLREFAVTTPGERTLSNLAQPRFGHRA
jgi:hypothetical protein